MRSEMFSSRWSHAARMTYLALASAAFMFAPAAQAKKKPKSPPAAWTVLRATDPVTLASSCTVVATDYIGKARFTQFGALYPVVELNNRHGLLVGVSSGGRFRMPVGDIVWSVDGKPFREIKAADNPVAGTPPTPSVSVGSVAGANAIAEVTANAMRMSQAMTATSTMASGDKARAMLREMLSGQSLLFRAAVPNAEMGLPNYNALLAGQWNSRGELKPIPIDDSFRQGLSACGIEEL